MIQVVIARKPVLRWIVVCGLVLAVPLSYFVAQWTRNKFLHELDNRATDELKVNLAYLQSRMDHLQTMTQIVATDDRVLDLLDHPDDMTGRSAPLSLPIPMALPSSVHRTAFYTAPSVSYLQPLLIRSKKNGPFPM